MRNLLRPIYFSMLLCMLTFSFSLTSCAKDTPNIQKKWLISSGDEQQLIDLSVPGKVIRACTYNAEFCKEVRGAYEPGVFYLMSEDVCRITPTTETSGDIEYLMSNGEYALVCSYQDLKADKATFIFEGEFEWEGVVNNNIKTVNPNTLEINIEDMITVLNNHTEDAQTMARLCEGKNLKLIRKGTVEYGNEVETWGRGLKVDGKELKRSGGEALGIQFKYHKEEFKMVELFFTDASLLKDLEKQMARLGYFPRKPTSDDNDIQVVSLYTSDEWEDESDEPIFMLKKDKDGLYNLYYCMMI